ncbi:hypothetical protein MtrunA17_Chr2g0280621 [Medicago truncatula]|uniref:Uncharacterized protein n=1 Tax=Medicago truncatula TaxID=3880 RepID=A0A396J1T8_MEDTR|nr:hypothetical protein MtrunA17_Chr2g0280621 [Medicago truncatula]
MSKHMGKLNNLQSMLYFIGEEHNGSDLKELAKQNHFMEQFILKAWIMSAILQMLLQ